MNKVIALLIASASAVQLEAIPAGSLMQNNPSHWRKVWPEGITDNADGDAEIIGRFNIPEVEKVTKGTEKYPWALSDEVKETQSSMQKALKITGEEEFSAAAAQSRGMDMMHTYDNTKNVMEQDLPYGATWADYNANMHTHGRGPVYPAV